MLELCSSVTLTVQMPLTFFNLPNENALSSPELSFGEKAEFFKREKWIFLSFSNRNLFQGTSNNAYFHVSLWWRRLTTTSNIIHNYPHFCFCIRHVNAYELWDKLSTFSRFICILLYLPPPSQLNSVWTIQSFGLSI